MTTPLTREEVIHNLTMRKFDDGIVDKINSSYPVSSRCPTCDDQGRYNLEGLTHECDCELQKMLQRHYFAANIGREYHDIGLQHFEGPDASVVVPAVEDYLANFDQNFHFGLGLTFNGPFGTGKTFAVCCVLKELIQRGRNVYFITFEELINIWGKSWQDDQAKMLLEKRLKTAEVLGLDELRTDARNAGGFLQNGLDSVIRHRTSNLLPTLVSTNMSGELERSEFGKVYSLLAAKNDRVETKGHDRRMAEVRFTNMTLARRGERRPIC
jgi:DNA replication protein DnaC